MLLSCRWLVLASVVALVNGEPVQLPGLQFPSTVTASAHQQAVVNLFNVSYEAYQLGPFARYTLRSF